MSAALVAAAVLSLATGGSAGAVMPRTSPEAMVRITSATTSLPHGAVVTGATDPGTTISAEVALKPRSPAALDAFVAAVSTPGSPTYHRFLGHGQFASDFGPSADTLASARSWLASNGLTVGTTSSDGMLIPVAGSVDQIERAFDVSLVDTRLLGGRLARYATAAPAVPSTLAPTVQGVLGLSTVALPQPQIVRDGPRSSSTAVTPAPGAVAATPHVGPGTCSSANTVAGEFGAYTANQLAGAYGLSNLYNAGQSGTGLTVGIYELEPYTQSDITTYQSCYGIANTVTKVAVDGGATGSQSGEAALDIEDVAGLATGATVRVYSGTQTGNGPVDTYDRMVTDDVAKVLTTSWGICEPEMAQNVGQQAAESSIFAEAAAQGQTMIAASGDSGSTDCYIPGVDNDAGVTVDDPADQPTVTGVGGTSLLGAAPTETVWNDSLGAGGGGVSSDFAMPSWQTGPGVGASTALSQCSAVGRSSCREVPDVAASADPAHGYVIFFGGSWGVYGGTSAASPLWAAMTAVIDQALGRPAGFLNPVLYGAGSCVNSPFNDVTVGTNAWISTAQGHFASTANYDVASGWGSGNAGRLVATLASPPVCPVVTAVDPAKGSPLGGNVVTVTGTDFSGVSAVRFGGSAASFSVTSATSLTAVAPAGPSGSTVDITVQGPDGSSRAVSEDRYTYTRPGYWLVASDGGIFTFGATSFFGSTGAIRLNQPIVGMATSADDRGYWLVASDGGIFSFGDAGFDGSTGALHLNKPIVGMAATPDGRGYWLVASDGGIFSFGDARFYGSTGALHLNKPIVGMAATTDGRGYWLVASDGGIFSFGDARFYGSAGALHLNKPIVGMAATPDGRGYWLVASDGGIFSFGDARFYGSAGALHLNKPIVGMAATPDGRGYWLVASDGGIFTLGDASFYGSTGALALNRPIVGMAST